MNLDPQGLPSRLGGKDPAPADEAYVVAVRELVRELVALDVEFGGDRTSALAVQGLSQVRRHLVPGRFRPHLRRDLWAATAELAELSGWLLCDANQQAAADRINQEAVALSRLSGDRSMELFTLHNMSLQATYLRRPERTLKLVEPVLERGRLTSRLTAMFQLRVARAYAQMGLRADALKVLGEANARLADGVSDRDPAWSWWISERGFSHATGALFGCLGEWGAAIEPVQRALEAAPLHARRDRFLYLCVLLTAQLGADARHDAEGTAHSLIPLIGSIQSTRPLATLAGAIDNSRRRGGHSPKTRDLIEQIWPQIHAALPDPSRR
jgi:tetratricopeptide (TPR) repeat protein